ncbi:unnamed protein product [Allacma fusca]|uniref:Suppressor of cytokine signaling 5 n=1 Tax=Allacma fusca TaxID=39272 RepID=A0A8J2P3E8_9HEXA|nr:unnamed protein product [Allacma fusca]
MSEQERNDKRKDAEKDSESDGRSSGSGETTCSSWKATSDKWKKKRRASKGTKRDFFGKRTGKKWPIRGNGKRDVEGDSPQNSSPSCICTGYRRKNSDDPVPSTSKTVGPPIIDLSKFNPADYPIDDEDERMRRQRAKEMQEGVDVDLAQNLGIGLTLQDNSYQIHTQVDFIHCLVPDLKEITSCSFYWGKIDRYEAEKLLEGKPEGTFLLRDSAQEEYLFSVSFRRYGRSLHARIEQWNHAFSFDSHDPSVFSSPTVTGLIEHYKDPSCCMFFEPLLTTPLHRNFPFDLQHLARSVISSHVKYDSINSLPLPKKLKVYSNSSKVATAVQPFQCGKNHHHTTACANKSHEKLMTVDLSSLLSFNLLKSIPHKECRDTAKKIVPRR